MSEDASDFEQFVSTRTAALLRLAVLLTADTHLAEDLVQTVLARAYQRWDRISSVERIEAYLKRMIVNEYLSWRRLRVSRELPTGQAPEIAVAADGAADRAERAAMWALLARLPRRQRAVVVLRYYEDLADAQIAAILGCSQGTVRSNAKRALDSLRAVLPADREALA